MTHVSSSMHQCCELLHAPSELSMKNLWAENYFRNMPIDSEIPPILYAVSLPPASLSLEAPEGSTHFCKHIGFARPLHWPFTPLFVILKQKQHMWIYFVVI